ncbi:phosphoglycolate phosphatase [Palleronia aestuarii]|uniref:Phosphoglycolate phosphatase n=1 Tax=Palleronia aestuarii TaxID=568105 RepID=A0A2W7N2Q3_9RHOB|nr:HAD hydrolase-like protein [Palleronia aestuarii]PZX14340.1 phosphoglycolate phosphatase [Palleronia aestuarii]
MTDDRPQGTFVLLDLDGTLVASAPGIVASLRHALHTLGRPAPAEATLDWVVGPPLRRSFETLLGEGGDVEAALALYRASYEAEGMFLSVPYPGIEDTLSALSEAGHRLFLCTAKPLPHARRIMAHLGLDAAFEGLYGATFDDRFDDKATLIAHILDERGLSARDGCMVGDREHDVLAARRNGMTALGVTWGYGGAAELAESGATRLCQSTGDLAGDVAALLRSETGTRAPVA